MGINNAADYVPSTVGYAVISNGANLAPTFQPMCVQPILITTVSTSPYVVLTTDFYLAVSTAAVRTIQLPNTALTGRVYIVKDKTGNGGTNAINVTTVGGVVLIDEIGRAHV